MLIRNKKSQKYISALLITLIIAPSILFSSPQKSKATGIPVIDILGNILLESMDISLAWIDVSTADTAVNTTDIAANTTISATTDTKSWIQKLLELLLKTAAKKVLAEMTKSTINWINTGFHGSPLFLENPDSFFKDIAKSQVKSIVDMIGYDTFRFPFGKQTALNVIDSYKSQLATNSQYSLSKVINDPDLLRRYQNDFNYGGWNGFLINTQYPQNNYLGFNMMIQQNLASRLEGTLVPPAQKVQDALKQGMGFLSPQICPESANPNYPKDTNPFSPPSFKFEYNVPEPVFDENNPDAYNRDHARWEEGYNTTKAIEKGDFDKKYDCPGGLVSTTPGSVAAHSVMTAIDSPFLSTALDGAIGNSLSAIFDALLNHFLDKGLNALKSTINPQPSTDNWSYNGQTLNGNNAGISNINIPQTVSVTEDDSTSASIAGIGKGPYIIQTQPNSKIATATIRNDTVPPVVVVTGVSAGQTYVVVKDSISPYKNAKIDIEVNYIGALVVRPPGTITTDTENPKTVNIYGGTAPYSIQTEGPNKPNQSVAIVSLGGSSLVIIGVGKGTTAVTIQDSTMAEDSFTPDPQTITLPIQVSTPEDLSIQQDISVNVNGVNNVIDTPILGGVVPYVIERVTDPTVATAQITGTNLDILTVTGKSAGQTEIRVRDLLNQISNIKVTVVDPNNPVGTCDLYGTISDNVLESNCLKAGGTVVLP